MAKTTKTSAVDNQAPAADDIIEQPIERVEPLAPASITPAEDPGKNAVNEIKLKFGEVALVGIDANGNEGILFKVSDSTYRAYYSNENKFRVKKTFQA